MRPPWWGRRNASRIGCRRGRTAPRETALAPCCWAAPALKRCASLPKPCCKACHAKVGSRARPHSISTAAAGVAGAVCALHLLPPACGAIRQPIGVADVIVAGLALIAVVPAIAPALLAPATPLGDALEALARLLGEPAAEGSTLRSSCAAAQAKGNEKGNRPSLVGHEQVLRAKSRGFRAAGRLTSFSLPRAHMPVTVARPTAALASDQHFVQRLSASRPGSGDFQRGQAGASDREAHARDPVFHAFQLLGRRGACSDPWSWQDDCGGLHRRRPRSTDRCRYPRRVRHALAHERYPFGWRAGFPGFRLAAPAAH